MYNFSLKMKIIFFQRAKFRNYCCCCSVAKPRPTLCDSMDYSTPGFLSFTIFQSLLRFTSIESLIEVNLMTLSAVSGFSRQEHWSFLLQCMKVKSESEVAQSYPTLSDPMDCSLPGSSVQGIFRQEYWSGLPFPSPMHESEK